MFSEISWRSDLIWHDRGEEGRTEGEEGRREGEGSPTTLDWLKLESKKGLYFNNISPNMSIFRQQ